MDWEYLVHKYDLHQKVTGVVHCGAHQAEERHDYGMYQIPVWWIEANPNLIPGIEAAIEDLVDQQVIHALLAPTDGVEMTLHISGPDYLGSSSVLDWGSHQTFSPLHWIDHITEKSVSLNTLWKEHDRFGGANMVVTDLQGYDGQVLSGAGWLLEQVEFVMCEINDREVYEGAMLLPDLDNLLATVDPGPPFTRVETHWVLDQGWGDALWVRDYEKERP